MTSSNDAQYAKHIDLSINQDDKSKTSSTSNQFGSHWTPDLRGDYGNIALLTLLYVLQVNTTIL